MTARAVLRASGLAALLLVTTAAAAESAPPRRVLFVGNSLTYVNDVPGLVEALAEADGQAGLETVTVAGPNLSLEDHWQRGPARRLIAEGGWDVVVLQQGPSSLPESRRNLVEWTRRFAGEIRDAGAEPALYMVWPDASRRHAFAQVSASYRAAADAVEGRVLPAGDAWRTAWKIAPDAPLYGPDGFHPSAAGSYLAALTIYAELFARSPEGLPASLTTEGGSVSLASPLARMLQQAAARVVDDPAAAR